MSINGFRHTKYEPDLYLYSHLNLSVHSDTSQMLLCSRKQVLNVGIKDL